MAKKMFTLTLKDDVEVRTLEELRENFDLEKVVEYFKSGELLEWLEDRFYDDESEAIENIDADDRNLTAKICAALDVECDDDLEFMQRLREKKAILAEMTDDENIIDNAASTALNQEDLATLINMDYKTIHLCGENFNVPIRVSGMKYIGVLSTPKIKIRAKSQEDLDSKEISFENVQLPWQKAAPIEELKALAEKIFQNKGKFPVVSLIEKRYSEKLLVTVSSFDQLNKAEKSMVLRMVCQGKYTEQQIAFMQITEDLSSGFAMTIDSFCTGGNVGANIIPYKSIQQIWGDYWNLSIQLKESNRWDSNIEFGFFATGGNTYNVNACEKLFNAIESKSDYEKIKRFLEVAKTF